MLELDPGMMVWTWITFIIVLIILSKVALKPILSAIENREKKIHDDIEEAKKQRDESEALLEKHKQMIDGAEKEAQKIINENQQLAEKTRQEMLDDTRRQSDKLIEKAKNEIDRQKESALISLKAEIADLAVGAAEKIILKNLDKEEHKNVVDEYIKSMPKSLKN
jgi:F-type H+-transporting ATPase subunit b